MTGAPASVRWRELQRRGPQPTVRIRLLGSFTLDTLIPHLGLALDGLGITAGITVGPFNQIVQECGDLGSGTTRPAPDVLIVWPRLEELWGGPVPSADADSADARTSHGLDDVAAAVGNVAAQLVVVLPATPTGRPLGAGDASSPAGVVALAAAARERFRTRLGSGVVVCDADDIMRAVGERAAYDRRLEVLAGLPYTDRFLAAVGDALARAVRLTRQPAKKAVVLDADGTLWGGAVGEVGAEGVDLGPGPAEAYVGFQRFLLDLRANGMLLTLCSKNAESDVWAAFDRRDMRLRREHLSAYRIGWRPKHASIVELAAELNIGVDSMVFIDDNAAELAEAGAALPDLTTVMMPADPVQWPEMVNSVAFDRLPPTTDDAARAKRIFEERERDQFRRTVAPETYLKRLDIRAVARKPDLGDRRRLAQLILKTNQMNLNGHRLPEPELLQWCESPDHEIRVIEVNDRFGDYGQVGAYIVSFATPVPQLSLFLLSCRALGRGVERMMIADAFEVAGRRGSDSLVAAVEETPRNEPARAFFASIGCAHPGEPSLLERIAFPSYITRQSDADQR